MARYTVVLDACVLVPVSIADTLLRIAERDLYRPKWSQRILDETFDAIAEVHPEIPPRRIEGRLEAMSRAFEDALVTDWESLTLDIDLPDADDCHVVAAAIRGRADAIVTANLRHFPAEVLGTLHLDVVSPDAFLMNQFDLAPGIVLDVLREQAEHARNPQLTVFDLVARLGRAGVPNFAEEARRHLTS